MAGNPANQFVRDTFVRHHDGAIHAFEVLGAVAAESQLLREEFKCAEGLELYDG
jgi:hypothetical protein